MELLEIEKELRGPEKKDALDKYDGILVELDTRLKAALREGLSPAEYERVSPLSEVVVIARKLLRLQAKD